MSRGRVSRTIPDPAISIGVYHLHYYRIHRHEVAQLMVRFHFARRDPPAYISNECVDAISSWAHKVWKRHQQTRAEPLPIVLCIEYYDCSEQHACQSETLKRVIFDRPTGEPKPCEGPVGGGGPGARPEPPTWLYGPRKDEGQSAR